MFFFWFMTIIIFFSLLTYLQKWHLFRSSLNMVPQMIKNQSNTINLLVSALHVIICQYLGKILMKYLIHSSDTICFTAALFLFAPIWQFSVKTWQSSLLSKFYHIHLLTHSSLYIALRKSDFLLEQVPSQMVAVNVVVCQWLFLSISIMKP